MGLKMKTKGADQILTIPNNHFDTEIAGLKAELRKIRWQFRKFAPVSAVLRYFKGLEDRLKWLEIQNKSK